MFVNIPDVLDNFFYEMLITFFYVFHCVCLARNFYKSANTLSYIDSEEIDEIVKNANLHLDIKDLDDSTSYSTNSKNIYSSSNLEICKRCDKLRIKRSHHCSICNACVEKHDHHCFILNNCIGKENYHYFVSYLYLVTLNSLIILTFCFFSILKYKYSENGSLSYMILSFPLRALILSVFSTISFCSVGYFFLHHLRLILYDQTGIEYKYAYKQTLNEEISKLSFIQKIKILKKNFLILMKSGSNNSLLDVYWPD